MRGRWRCPAEPLSRRSEQQRGVDEGAVQRNAPVQVRAGHATRGADAADPVDRASSRVQAAAVFYPVTDLTNLAGSTEDPGDGGPPIHFRAAFRQEPVDMAAWRPLARELSPIHHVTADLPPVLIHHGDRDTLVTPEQVRRLEPSLRAAGVAHAFHRYNGAHAFDPVLLKDLLAR